MFDYIKYLKNQNDFSKWVRMDPDMKKNYTGTDATVGFLSSWAGNGVGQGEQEIKKITEGESVDYEIRFIKPWKSIAHATMATEAVGKTRQM